MLNFLHELKVILNPWSWHRLVLSLLLVILVVFPCLDWPALNSLLHSSMMLTDLVLDLPCHTTLLCSSELNLCPSFSPGNLTCESLFLWMKRRIRKSRLWYKVWRLHTNWLSFNASLCVCVCVSRKWCTYIDTKLHNLHIVNLRFSHIAGDCSVWNTYYASSVEPHNQYLDLELDKWWGTNQCLIIFPPTKYWKDV